MSERDFFQGLPDKEVRQGRPAQGDSQGQSEQQERKGRMGFRAPRNADGPLRPHKFEQTVQLIGERPPRVLLTPEVYKRICLYVEIAEKEVGWMGTVSRTADGDFLIEETFLLEQQVHETETELAAEDIGRLTMELIDSGADGLDKANRLRFWGHSHVHMATSASGTDERTMDRFGREQVPWYVRGIFNKMGTAEFTIFLFDRGLRINDARWVVWDPVKNQALFLDADGYGPLSFLFSDRGGLAGKQSSPDSPELKPGAELRAAVTAEFKAKVKERPSFFSFGRGSRYGEPSPNVTVVPAADATAVPTTDATAVPAADATAVLPTDPAAGSGTSPNATAEPTSVDFAGKVGHAPGAGEISPWEAPKPL